MIPKLCKPFRNCTKANISQGFIKGQHEANDFYSFYGDILLAPENVKILNIIDSDMTAPEDWGSPDNGYGILMASIENPERTYSFWHCWANFPCNIGDTILKGKPVAFEGNSGYVISGGVVIKGEARFKPPYPGTHDHITAKDENGSFDFSQYVDWDYNPTLTFQERLLVIQIAIKRITDYLKRSATN
jgi:hypothetical protein